MDPLTTKEAYVGFFNSKKLILDDPREEKRREEKRREEKRREDGE